MSHIHFVNFSTGYIYEGRSEPLPPLDSLTKLKTESKTGIAGYAVREDRSSDSSRASLAGPLMLAGTVVCVL